MTSVWSFPTFLQAVSTRTASKSPVRFSSVGVSKGFVFCREAKPETAFCKKTRVDTVADTARFMICR